VRIFFFMISCYLFSSDPPFYYFIPPKKWDVVASDKLPKGTVIAFIEKCHKPFKASINLGIEKTSMQLDRYVEVAKKKILADRSNSWTSLGYITQSSWKGHLAQIDSKNGCGDVRSLQCIIADSHYIYVLTGVALKEDHAKNAPIFIEIFESFSLQDSALNSLKNNELKKSFAKQRQDIHEAFLTFSKSQPETTPSLLFDHKEFQKKHWLPFEQKLQKTHKNLGLFWQAQAAKELKKDLLSNTLNINILKN
jgi:hypothetical protein